MRFLDNSVIASNTVLPALTSLLGFVFAGFLLARFAQRQRPYHLVWALGLLWYAVAAGAEALGGAVGWTAGLYRAWYITGAIGVAAYLGAGTVYLHKEPGFGSLTVVCVLLASAPALAGGHIAIGLGGLGAATLLTLVLTAKPGLFAHTAFVLLLVASCLAVITILDAPVDVSLLPTSDNDVVSGQALPSATRALTPAFNISGASLLLFGALISAVQFWRSRAQPNRVVSNVLIAFGAFVPSLSSGLTRFGITSVFFVGELLGLVCIVAGFLLSGSTRQPPSSDPSASSGPS